jgi:hypothetical protein
MMQEELDSSASYALAVVTKGAALIPTEREESIALLGEVVAELVHAGVLVSVGIPPLEGMEETCYRITPVATEKEGRSVTAASEPAEPPLRSDRAGDRKTQAFGKEPKRTPQVYGPVTQWGDASSGRPAAGAVQGLSGDTVSDHADDAVDDRQRV